MKTGLIALALIASAAFVGCGTPGSEGEAGSLRVKVIDNHGGNVAGATVVLGDRNGSLITTGVTNSIGESRFIGPPADATVTVAHTCVFSNPALYNQFTGTARSITAAYDVNVTAVSLYVNNCDAGAVADLTVNIINLPSAAVYASAVAGGEGDYAYGPVSGGQAQIRMPVYSNAVQQGGKISIAAMTTDSSNRPVSYGMLLDQDVVSQMTVTVDAGNAFSDSVQYLATNLPPSARYLNYSLALSRSGTAEFIVAPDTSTVSTATTTMSVLMLPGYGDRFHYEVTAELDRNQNGMIDGWIDMGNMEGAGTVPSDQSFDFSQALIVPEIRVISFTSGTARAQVTWTGTDGNADSTMGFVQYTIPGYGMSFDFTGAPTRTSFVFPQLPDELEVFRPHDVMDVRIYNFASAGLSGYNDLLNKLDRSPSSLYSTGAYMFSGGTATTNMAMKPKIRKNGTIMSSRTPHRLFFRSPRSVGN